MLSSWICTSNESFDISKEDIFFWKHIKKIFTSEFIFIQYFFTKFTLLCPAEVWTIFIDKILKIRVGAGGRTPSGTVWLCLPHSTIVLRDDYSGIIFCLPTFHTSLFDDSDKLQQTQFHSIPRFFTMLVFIKNLIKITQ